MTGQLTAAPGPDEAHRWAKPDLAAPAYLAGRADMRQVAARAGVAVSSVSRVLSGHPDVSATMRDRVMSVVEELGYEPNRLAQMLRMGATKTVGFVVGDISNPLLAQIALGAEVTLRAAGYATLLTNSVNHADFDAQHIRLLQQRHVDGLLLSINDETSQDMVAALAKATVPTVLIDRSLPVDIAASSVLSDHATGIRLALDHLIKLGHRRIALVAGSPHVRPTRERVSALEDAIERHPDLIGQVRVGAFTETHGAAATRELLDGRRPPTAIIAGGNQILVGVLGEIAARGLRIPKDISVVTCDDIPLAKLFTPALATVGRDPTEMGTVAAQLMLARIDGGEPSCVTLPTVFDPARSCARPRT